MTFIIFCLILATLWWLIFSPYRRYGLFFAAGMGFWIIIEVLRISMQALFEVSVWTGYLMSVFLLLLGFVALLYREDRKVQKRSAPPLCIEHTPVYGEQTLCMPNKRFSRLKFFRH